MQIKQTLARLLLILFRPQSTTPWLFRCASLKGSLTLIPLFLLLLPFSMEAQSTYLPEGDKAYILMERMEIKSRNDSFFNFSKTKPYTREHTVSAVSNYLQRYGNGSLSKTDTYNAERVFMNNNEYLPEQFKYASKKPVLQRFYKTPANLYEVHVKDFDLV